MSRSSNVKEIVKICEENEINTIQTMPTSPMMWSTKEIPLVKAKVFSEGLNNSKIKKVFFVKKMFNKIFQ